MVRISIQLSNAQWKLIARKTSVRLLQRGPWEGAWQTQFSALAAEHCQASTFSPKMGARIKYKVDCDKVLEWKG
jgi:hypothetical protein